MTPEDITNRFTYHPPKEGQPQVHESIRKLAREFAGAINELCPEGREKSLAVTNLEQAVFWANAAIARAEA